MRIAIFTDNFPPQVNGVVIATLNLIKGLADRGHKIYVIAPRYRRGARAFEHKNVVVRRVFGIPALFYEHFKLTSFFSFRILNYLREEKIQLIHFPSPITLGLEAVILSRLLKLPLVGTFHTFFADPGYLKHAHLNHRATERLFWEYSKFFYNRCDLVTSPSQETKKDLLKHGFKSAIEVISNGIDRRVFSNAKAKEVKLKYNPHGPLLLFVGRVAHEKNIFYLLDCFRLVVREIHNAKLLIVGGGPQTDEVKEKIRHLGLADSVVLSGEIEYARFVKSSILGASDIFVTASVTENQPLTVLEAQANGVVCVGIDARGMRDLVRSGYNGFLVKNGDKKAFADAVVKILKHKNLWKKMKRNTLEEIKNHDLNRSLDQWERVLGKLIAESGRG